MDRSKKNAIYAAVLVDTAEARSKLVEFWASLPEKPSKSEDRELDREIDYVSKLAGVSASVAMAAIDSADDAMGAAEALRGAEEWGLVGSGDPEDDPEDEDNDLFA